MANSGSPHPRPPRTGRPARPAGRPALAAGLPAARRTLEATHRRLVTLALGTPLLLEQFCLTDPTSP
ncbi:hypothetical protein [Streptomyces sp. NPDC001594]|uniref:hypothetical protein n=1 Tax=Streptomyces sp. NPDC001594 TaxID=3364590 RepID=UPI003680DC4E